MKLVPIAFTCTPWRATSAATFFTNIVAPARAAEYSGAFGVGRAGCAGEHQHLPVTLAHHHGHDSAQEVERRFQATGDCRTQVVERRVEERAGDDAATEGHRGIDAPEPLQRSVHQRRGRSRVGQIAHAVDHLDRGTRRAQFLDQPGGRVADDQIVPTRRQQPGDGRPDVEARIGDERYTAGGFGCRHRLIQTIDMIGVNLSPALVVRPPLG